MPAPHRDCAQVEALFERLLDGALPPAERSACLEHLATCARCADLAEFAGLAHQPAGAPPSVAGAVLARTTGEPCGAASEALCERQDGALDALGLELLDGHLRGCATCRRRELALGRLARTLPRLAEVRPDPRFVEDVLRATLGRDPRQSAGARLAAMWSSLVLRPRFGLEAAYAGALALLMLFGLPVSPLRDVPEQALEAYLRGTEALVAGASGVGETPRDIARAGAAAWGWTSARGAESMVELRREIATRYEATAPTRRALGEVGERLGEAATDLDWSGGNDVLREMSHDLGAFVRSMTAPSTPDTPEPQDSGTR